MQRVDGYETKVFLAKPMHLFEICKSRSLFQLSNSHRTIEADYELLQKIISPEPRLTTCAGHR